MGFESIAVSGHKFFGIDSPCGLFICTREVYDNQSDFDVPYLNKNMRMINCSRDPIQPLKFWWVVQKVGAEEWGRQARRIMELTAYLKQQLDKAGYPAWVNEYSNTVFMRCPSPELAHKYQLAQNEASFVNSLGTGLNYVSENDVLLVMGVRPTRPEPGYGYIQMGDLSCKPDVYRVKSFTEKPERQFATMFMESGEFYWNTGVFIANARYLIESFEKIFPEVLRNLKFENPDYTYEEELEYVAAHYPQYPNLSLDYAILEHSSHVYVMTCNFGWADLGTWHAVYESMSRTVNDNVVVDSTVMMEDSHNNVIKLPKGRLGVINGLDGYIVAEEGNVLLICKKGDSSALVRKYVNEVQMKYGDEFV